MRRRIVLYVSKRGKLDRYRFVANIVGLIKIIIGEEVYTTVGGNRREVKRKKKKKGKKEEKRRKEEEKKREKGRREIYTKKDA